MQEPSTPQPGDGPAAPLLAVAGLRKTHVAGGERIAVLRGVDLALAAGRSLALMGESGSGKSTLLHLVAGLDQADAGSIRLAGQEMTALPDAGRARLRRTAVGLVFQQFNLIPSLDVGANLAFQARLAGRHDPALTARLAERLGLGPMLRRYPEQLSGGQQQRVAIGRALAARPALVLADEPTGNLDEATGDAVLDLMLELVREAGCGLLMVTHSLRLAARCDACATLRAGRIAAPGADPGADQGAARAPDQGADGGADPAAEPGAGPGAGSSADEGASRAAGRAGAAGGAAP